MFGAILLVMGGMILAYWIPNWAARSQGKIKKVNWQMRWMIVGLFLCFSVLAWYKWRVDVEFYLFVPCIWILLLISITDYWFGLIPNIFTYPSIVALGVARWWTDSVESDHYFLAMLLGGISVYLIAIVTRGIGIGDAKLVALGGLLVGFPNIFFAFWLATVSAMLYVVWRWALGKKIGRKEPISFGPHLVVGILFTHLYMDSVLLLYRSWFYPFYHVIS